MKKNTSIILLIFLILFCTNSLLSQTKTSAVQEDQGKEILKTSTILKVSKNPSVIRVGKVEQVKQENKQKSIKHQENDNVVDTNVTSDVIMEKRVNNSQRTFIKNLEMKIKADTKKKPVK